MSAAQKYRPQQYSGPPPTQQPKQVVLHAIGEMSITCVEAANLAGSEEFSKMNPYVQVQMNPSPVRRLMGTKSHKRGSRNPKWGETLVFDVFPGEHEALVRVMDRANFGNDQRLGLVKLPILGYLDQQVHDEWYKLSPDPQSKVHPRPDMGGVHLVVQYLNDATSRSVMVANVPTATVHDEVATVFGSCDRVNAVHFTPGGQLKYALVEFASRQGKRSALAMNGKAVVGGSMVTIEPAKISIPEQVEFERTGKTPDQIAEEKLQAAEAEKLRLAKEKKRQEQKDMAKNAGVVAGKVATGTVSALGKGLKWAAGSGSKKK